MHLHLIIIIFTIYNTTYNVNPHSTYLISFHMKVAKELSSDLSWKKWGGVKYWGKGPFPSPAVDEHLNSNVTFFLCSKTRHSFSRITSRDNATLALLTKGLS